MKYKKILAFLQMFLVVSLSFVFAVNFNSTDVFSQEQQVCCEIDNEGNYCSYVDVSKCTGTDVQKAATSCDQTSFCQAGVCAGVDGFCYENYPRALCESNEGSFTAGARAESVPQCKLGCCMIGTQADYVTRDRCIEATSAYPDLEVDFRDDVVGEQACLNLARNQVQGCCAKPDGVCSYGAKSECDLSAAVSGAGFYEDVYCSDEQLRNICECAPSNPELGGSGELRGTTCLADRDEVYWKDSCGNPEGVVGPGVLSGQKNNALADGSGKCDYNFGTLCGDSDGDGIHVCESLDCTNTEFLSLGLEGYEEHGTEDVDSGGVLNGESWCQFDSEDQQQIFNEMSTADRQGKDPVGSRYYRSLCINSQELIEPCKDFREEYCYANTIDVEEANRLYTEARCIENEWEVCSVDCATADPLTMNENEYEEALEKDQQCCLSANRDCTWTGAKCVPAVSPGFKFWEGEGTDVCGRASTECTTVFVCGGWNRLFGCDRAGLAGGVLGGAGAVLAGGYTAVATGGFGLPVVFGGLLAGGLIGGSAAKSGWNIVSGKECLSQDFLQAANNLCRSYGDCGADFNYLADEDLDDKFTFSNSGFVNTEDIGDELAEAARNDQSIDEDFGDEVPGNLTERPDWEKGKEFFDFTRPVEKPIGGAQKFFRRFLFTEDDITGQGWLSPGALALGSLATGLIAAGVSSSITPIAVGLSASPFGFLVSQALGFALPAGAAKTAFEGGLSGARTAVVEQATDNAVEVLNEEFAGSIGRGSLSRAQEIAVREVLNDKIGENAVKQMTSQDILNAVSGRVHVYELNAQGLPIGTKQISTETIRNEAAKVYTDNSLSKEVTKKAIAENVENSFANVMTGISAALWAYTIFQFGDIFFEDVKPVKIEATCQPWQAPVYRTRPDDTDQCSMCNPDFEDYIDDDGNPADVKALKSCSEYRCKSLGASCELLNEGSGEELCVSVNKLDTNSPKIEPWEEGFTLDLREFNIVENPQKTGFKVEGEIPIYTPFVIGLKTDEPAQCKMSFEHSQRFNDMQNIFFGGNTFKYFHLNQMMYPATRGANETEGITLQGGGHYRLNLRCTDAVGNSNEADYVIEFDVEAEPDLTAPDIVGSSITPPNPLGEENIIGNEVYLTYGATYTDVTLFVNEPAECKYSYNPLDYSFMDENNRCNVASNNPESPPYYECKFVHSYTGGGIGPAPSGFNSTAGLRQFVYFKCKDRAGNFNRDAYTVLLRGSEPVEIENTKPTGLIKTSSAIVNVTLEVETSGGAYLNGNSLCKYTTEESARENLGAMTFFLNTNSSMHKQPWQPSTGMQKFYLGCYDIAGNVDYGTIEFEVEQDVTPPFITKVYRDENFQPPQFTVQISEAGQCKDSTEDEFDYETGGNLMNVINVNSTIFSSTIPQSDIYYVRCRDNFGNVMNTATIQIT